METIRFKINKELAEQHPSCDFEYTAFVNKKTTLMTWIENGVNQETLYSTRYAKKCFNNGTWVKTH